MRHGANSFKQQWRIETRTRPRPWRMLARLMAEPQLISSIKSYYFTRTIISSFGYSSTWLLRHTCCARIDAFAFAFNHGDTSSTCALSIEISRFAFCST